MDASSLLAESGESMQLERESGVVGPTGVNFLQKLSAYGADVNGETSQAGIAYRIAQPWPIVGGFIIAVVTIGLMLLIDVINEAKNGSYLYTNSMTFRGLLFGIPAIILVLSIGINYNSNGRRDSSFLRRIDYGQKLMGPSNMMVSRS